MWILTNVGMVSVVLKHQRKRPENDIMAVRARKRQHLVNLFGDQIRIIDNEGTDYAFRVHVRRSVVQSALVRALNRVDYPNFKDSVKEKPLKAAYSRIWNVLYELQPSRRSMAHYPTFWDHDRRVAYKGAVDDFYRDEGYDHYGGDEDDDDPHDMGFAGDDPDDVEAINRRFREEYGDDCQPIHSDLGPVGSGR